MPFPARREPVRPLQNSRPCEDAPYESDCRKARGPSPNDERRRPPWPSGQRRAAPEKDAPPQRSARRASSVAARRRIVCAGSSASRLAARTAGKSTEKSGVELAARANCSSDSTFQMDFISRKSGEPAQSFDPLPIHQQPAAGRPLRRARSSAPNLRPKWRSPNLQHGLSSPRITAKGNRSRSRRSRRRPVPRPEPPAAQSACRPQLRSRPERLRQQSCERAGDFFPSGSGGSNTGTLKLLRIDFCGPTHRAYRRMQRFPSTHLPHASDIAGTGHGGCENREIIA